MLLRPGIIQLILSHVTIKYKPQHSLSEQIQYETESK
jgi:hypothetical protein